MATYLRVPSATNPHTFNLVVFKLNFHLGVLVPQVIYDISEVHCS